MIKNERQFLITKAQVEKFEHAVANLAKRKNESAKIHPLLLKAEEDALRAQLMELRVDIEEYELLRSGKRDVFEVQSFDELPHALIKARIALAWTQKDLAEHLGLKEQQIQRYEATDYASASLTRLNEVIQALGLRMREEVHLPVEQISANNLFRRLAEVGLDRDFVVERLIPSPLSARLLQKSDEKVDGSILQAAQRIGRIFGWSPDIILGSDPLKMSAPAGVSFKIPAKRSDRRLSAYVVYAHYLSLLVLEAVRKSPQKPVPQRAEDVRASVLSTYGSLTFESVVRYVWKLGIPVVPLNDPGVFHGACWRTSGRSVIVLKQRTSSLSRWLFDLLHELRHVGQRENLDQLSIIESSEESKERWQSSEEQDASRFAGDVMLAGRSEELAELCVKASSGAVEYLKAAVPRIAAKENVQLGDLANYMAFRLSMQDINWWGTANNLQETGENPWRLARDIFLEFIDLDATNELDRDILMQALHAEEGES
ncbi:helix-turn-helix domain-containing protein [Chloroflexota bacterium]